MQKKKKIGQKTNETLARLLSVFANSVRIKLASPQAAQLSLFFRRLSES